MLGVLVLAVIIVMQFTPAGLIPASDRLAEFTGAPFQ
jgi:hypothetical protein